MKNFSPHEKRIVVISILASFVSFLDGFIVTVALPAIAQEFGGGLAIQQWVVNAYLLTLGSLILLAGSLSDIFGRLRILYLGLIGFGATSLLCAVAPDGLFLVIARGLQGMAGALLVPSSLALIMSTFQGSKQSKAIGIWTSWTVVAAIAGPLVGGLLVDASSWRLIFGINIIPIIITMWLMRPVSELKTEKSARLDSIGALLCAVGLGSVTYSFIEQPQFGWSHPLIYGSLGVGIILLALFIWYERRSSHPMVPLSLFTNRNFSMGNLATIFIYGGLSVSSFIVTIFLQQVAGFSALFAGLAFIPVTILMFFLSSLFGGLSGKYGPRIFMSLGPVVAGIGFLLMLFTDQSVNYWTDLLPGVIVFGLGLSMTVAPLTSAILGSISAERSGIGSAINNAVSRIAGLIAVAAVGIVTSASLNVAGFHIGLFFTAALLFIGGAISAVGIRNSLVKANLPEKH
ncbi:MAG TPA: MFS transporter [Candidatus Saccharimonadales bacterium]|nr:MFS transporter [Candidatus Saccharimonadales bacterium]